MTTQTNQTNDEQIRVKAGFTNHWTTVQNYVLDCMSFEKPIDKLTYINLLRFAFNDDSVAYPSVKKLAMMASVSENTVRDAIKRLVKMDLVTVEEREKENGENESNLYTVYDLSDKMKRNSVSDKNVYKEALKADRERKREKAEKKKPGTSNSEGGKKGTSNSEGGTSNIEGGGSNSEDKKEDYKTNTLKTNKSISSSSLASRDSIDMELKEKYPDKPFDKIKKKLLKDIKAGNPVVKNDDQYRGSLKYRLENYTAPTPKQPGQPTQPKKQYKKAPVRTEVLPDWFDEAKQPVVSPTVITDLEAKKASIAEKLASFRS